MNRIFAFVLLAFGFASAAHAIPTTWTDSADIGGGQYIAAGGSYTYIHDLTDNGFRPSIDRIDSFSLAINLADDQKYDSFEWAFIDLPGFLFGDGLVGEFTVGDEFTGGFSLLGRYELNTQGTLTVIIQSVNVLGMIGDFNLLSSTLTARGDSATNVPEPGALGLLGLGLIGIALSKRRRKAA